MAGGETVRDEKAVDENFPVRNDHGRIAMQKMTENMVVQCKVTGKETARGLNY